MSKLKDWTHQIQQKTIRRIKGILNEVSSPIKIVVKTKRWKSQIHWSLIQIKERKIDSYVQPTECHK